MTSRNLYSKLIRQNIRRRIWAVALSALACLFTLLLPVAMVIQQYYSQLPQLDHADQALTLKRTAENCAMVLGTQNFAIQIAMIALAIVCGVAAFRYLHDRRQVDFYHALPVRRSGLFLVQYVSGLVCVLPVYLLVYLLTTAVTVSLGFGSALTAYDIGTALVWQIVFFLLNYTVAALCTVLTGNTIITILLGAWMMLGIPAAAGCVSGLMNRFFMTYVYDPELLQNLMRYGSPMLLGLGGGRGLAAYVFGSASEYDGTWQTIGVGALMMVILLVLTIWLFRRRRSERAGCAIAFPLFCEPLKWFMAAVAGVFFALIFDSIGGAPWFWFGLVLGVVLCHIVAEIVYAFDFRCGLRHWKRMLVLLVVVVAGVFSVYKDVYGYDEWIPEVDEVAAVGLENSAYGEWFGSTQAPEMTSAENIDRVLRMAQLGVESNVGRTPGVIEYNSEYGSQWYTLHYQLTNGKKVVRRYQSVPATEELEELWTSMQDSEEFIRAYSRIQKMEMPEADAQISKMTAEIRTNGVVDNDTYAARIEGYDNVARLLAAMQADQLSRTRAESEEMPLYRIDLMMQWYTMADDGSGERWTKQNSANYCPVYASDSETLAVLADLTDVTPDNLDPSEVLKVDVTLYAADEYNALHEQADALEREGYYERSEELYNEFNRAHSKEIVSEEGKAAVLEGAMLQAMYRASDYRVPLALLGGGSVQSVWGEEQLMSDGNGLQLTVEVTLNTGGKEYLYYPVGSMPEAYLLSLFPQYQ